MSNGCFLQMQMGKLLGFFHAQKEMWEDNFNNDKCCFKSIIPLSKNIQ